MSISVELPSFVKGNVFHFYDVYKVIQSINKKDFRVVIVKGVLIRTNSGLQEMNELRTDEPVMKKQRKQKHIHSQIYVRV